MRQWKIITFTTFVSIKTVAAREFVEKKIPQPVDGLILFCI